MTHRGDWMEPWPYLEEEEASKKKKNRTLFADRGHDVLETEGLSPEGGAPLCHLRKLCGVVACSEV